MELKRIESELINFSREPLPYLSACLIDENDLHNWKGVIMGPDNSPYAGGAFFFNMTFPTLYPFHPP